MVALLTVAAAYAILTVAQGVLATRYAARHKAGNAADSLSGVTVLQPILSGDPDLEPNLRANLGNCPDAHFLWLVDDDDRPGQEIARRVAREFDLGRSRVTIVTGPGPANGENPKLAKLARGLPSVTTPIAAVLDDDTVIAGGELSRLAGSLASCGLATGLPIFAADRTWYEHLVGGFVNGNAILTYFPAAALGIQRTINGMIYAFATDTLRGLGGFDAVKESLTDDYAVGMLFHNAGLKVFQAPVFVEVTMSIRDCRHYGRVMRRWMIFANMYLSKNTNAATLALTGLPAVLPLAGTLIAIGVGWRATLVWLACLAAKAGANLWLLHRISRRVGAGRGWSRQVAAHVLSAILLPFFYLTALVRPARLTWRSRNLDLSGGTIRYR